MSHPLSLAFLTVMDAGPLEAVRIAAATGYHMVGLRALPAAASGEGPYPLLTDDTLLAEVKAALDETGVRLGDMEIIRLKEATDIASFEPLLARTAFLGGRHLLVAGDDTDEARLTGNFAKLCELASRFNLTADLEFMPWTAVKTLSDARRIVEAAGHANGGVLIDGLHFDRSGSTLEEIRALPAERINYVQVCDGPVPYDPSDEGMIFIARNGRLLPGDGGIDLEGMVRAVPDGVTISVEIPLVELAKTVGPMERARMARDATVRLLEKAGRAVAGPLA
ncbi:MAG: sugar phosphate isomerase/epimerase [Notoacmeibacter sp.]|nr:sugar phosphate isomerase/epimerase [Notoacmeibacter sp.]